MMKIKVYNLISECVERGTKLGYRSAHKHTDTPNEEYIFDRIHTDIMNELCEYFTFDDETIVD